MGNSRARLDHDHVDATPPELDCSRQPYRAAAGNEDLSLLWDEHLPARY
jgi:hypothetical protein